MTPTSYDKNIKNKKYIKKYVCGGMGGVIIGFIVDPVSVVGLLMKLGRVHSAEGNKNVIKFWGGTLCNSAMKYIAGNKEALILFGILMLVSLFYFIKKVWKQDAVDRKMIYFLGICLLEEIIVVPIITGQAYFKALYPLIFLLIIYIISEFMDEVRRKYVFKHINVVILIAIIVFGIHSIYFVIKDKNIEGMTLWEKEALLEENSTDNLVFIRKQAMGYDFVPVLQNYNNTLVVTRPQGYYEGYENSELFIEAQELTVVTCDDSLNDSDMLNWLKINGFIEQSLLMEDDSYRIYHVERVAKNNG